MPAVRDLMGNIYMKLSPSDGIEEAARKFRETQSKVLVVCEGSKFRGVVKEADILALVGEDIRKLRHTRVGSLADFTYPKASPGQDILDAARVMADKGVTELPVVQNGRLLGMLTLGALAQTAPALAAVVTSIQNGATPAWPDRLPERGNPKNVDHRTRYDDSCPGVYRMSSLPDPVPRPPDTKCGVCWKPFYGWSVRRCDCGATVHSYCWEKHVVQDHSPGFTVGYVDSEGKFRIEDTSEFARNKQSNRKRRTASREPESDFEVVVAREPRSPDAFREPHYEQANE